MVYTSYDLKLFPHTAMIKPTYVVLFLVPLSTLCLLHPARARLNTLSGGITTGFDYNETNYSSSYTGPGSAIANRYLKKLSIGPLFILETSSSIDQLTLSYSPNFTYDFERSSSKADQKLSLTGYRDFSRNFSVSLRESLIFSDDPDLISTENSSDFNRARRRYWTSDFSINPSYSYATESSLAAGYANRILRNDDTGPGGYEDYDRHVLDLSLQHRIANSLNGTVTTSYTRGIFDPPEQLLPDAVASELEVLSAELADGSTTQNLSGDLSEYRGNATLNWIFSPRKTFQVSYGFLGTTYDAILRNNSVIHNITLGAQYQYSPRLSLSLGGGPSYEKTKTFDRTLGYNANADLNYALSKRATVTAKMTAGYDQQNFSSNISALGRDQGLTKYMEWKLGLSRKIIKNLQGNLFASYRTEDQESIINGVVNDINNGTDLLRADRETFRDATMFTRKIYLAGGSLRYSFMKWWSTAVSYSYRKQDSARSNDSYDEHRLYLTLSVQKEILRW